MKSGPRYWLMKSEPDAFSIDDLQRLKRAPWDGVRNFQARNHMRDMKVGDIVLFYHSSCDAIGVVGLARVVKEAYPDHTQFVPKSEHYDAKSDRAEPRWSMVDVEFIEKFGAPYGLQAMKDDPKLEGMLVTRKGSRLSVQPVETRHALHVAARAGAKTKLGT